MSIYFDLLRMEEERQSLTEHSIVKAFNEATGSDIFHACTNEYAIMEASADSVRKKLGLFDRIKLKLVSNNKKFLDKYKEKALANNPIGLVVDEYYTSIDLDSNYKKAMSIIKSIKEDDNKETSSSLLAPLDKNTYFKKVSLALCNQKSMLSTLSKDAYCTLHIDHKITKQDVKDAVKLLETVKTEIDNISSESKKLAEDYLNSAFKFNSNNKELTKDNKIIRRETSALRYLATNKYLDLKYNQLKELQKQARAIVLMAATHNPRNIKESLIETAAYKEYSDYCFDTFTEEVENFQ